MTSYNLVNGIPASANWESINGILRGEWGYDGVVMTDRWTHTNIEEELAAGSDVKMPELITYTWDDAPDAYNLTESLFNSKLDRSVAYVAVRRILMMMGKFE